MRRNKSFVGLKNNFWSKAKKLNKLQFTLTSVKLTKIILKRRNQNIHSMNAIRTEPQRLEDGQTSEILNFLDRKFSFFFFNL